MQFRNLILALTLFGALYSTATTWACNVPVFRYALERWRPDPYEAVLFHKGPLTPEQQKFVAELRAASEQEKSPANVEVQTVDLAGDVPEPLRKLWQSQANATLPWLVVRYPSHASLDTTVWAGSPTQEIGSALLQSPARREIARRLLKGDSVVWVLIETGDPKKDDATADLLKTELGRLQKSLKLPDDNEDPNVKDTVPLLAELPLRIAFSVLRVSRADPAEKLLVAMILNTDDEVARMKDVPIMVPVFGRGRALDPFCGKGINSENVESVARFLCGACSCTVKKLNPGVDLLFAANWETALGMENAPPPEPPSKPGVPVAIPRPSAAPVEKPAAAPVAATPVSAAPAEAIDPRSSMSRYLWLGAVGLGLLLAVMGTAALRSRKPLGESSP